MVPGDRRHSGSRTLVGFTGTGKAVQASEQTMPTERDIEFCPVNSHRLCKVNATRGNRYAEGGDDHSHFVQRRQKDEQAS